MPTLNQNSLRGIGIACTTAGIVALHAGAAVFFASHDPYSSTVFPPCPILALTGWQCPGCGGTRATYSLFHGDVVTSLRMNPLVIAGYLSGVFLAGMIGANWAGKQRLARILSIAAIAVVAATGIYTGIIRNLLAG